MWVCSSAQSSSYIVFLCHCRYFFCFGRIRIFHFCPLFLCSFLPPRGKVTWASWRADLPSASAGDQHLQHPWRRLSGDFNPLQLPVRVSQALRSCREKDGGSERWSVKKRGIEGRAWVVSNEWQGIHFDLSADNLSIELTRSLQSNLALTSLCTLTHLTGKDEAEWMCQPGLHTQTVKRMDRRGITYTFFFFAFVGAKTAHASQSSVCHVSFYILLQGRHSWETGKLLPV